MGYESIQKHFWWANPLLIQRKAAKRRKGRKESNDPNLIFAQFAP
jgi:hypothetical protein